MARTSVLLSIAILSLAACGEPEPDPGPDAGPAVHVITENPDGTFSPMSTTARAGDRVVWELAGPTAAVVPVIWSGDWPAPCATPAPWSETDPGNIAGPRPATETGVYTISPVGIGLVSQAVPCAPGTEVSRETDYLCRAGAPGATMEATWADPAIDGVFVRLLWSQLEPADCSSADLASCWDWSAVDREVSAAAAHGKLYSISVKAGDDGTPDWIFSTDRDGTVRVTANGGVTRLHLQDSGSDTPGCGARMDLGDPTEAAYRAQYFDMWTALAAHLTSRADWYRALAAVKPSGANLQSHENRLPKRCDTSAGCVCNTAVLAARGYTDVGLYDFYTAQLDLLARLFPGKTLSYALIQQGFPRISSATCYEIDEDAGGGTQTSGCPLADLPGASEQTETILGLGAAAATAGGFVWTVSHNGLGPSGAPNQHVLDAAAADATTITGFQTSNESRVADAVALDDTFANLERNALEATYLEIYEERQWEARQIGGVLDPAGSGRTIGAWADLLRDRRRTGFPALPDPEPTTHEIEVHYTGDGSADQVIHFVDPSRCGGPGTPYGSLTIAPS